MMGMNQLRVFVSPKRKPAKRKNLQVKISKEPPVIHKYTQDKLEWSSECIFDPCVHHDDESDHPDLCNFDGKKRLRKPWECPPYASEPSALSCMLKRLSWHPIRRTQTIAAPMSPV